MQNDLTPTSPTDTTAPRVSQALPPMQRRIVLGMWAGLLLFATVALYPIDWPDPNYWYLVWAGAWLAQVSFPAVCLALAVRPLSVRLPRALALTAVLVLAIAWGNTRNMAHDALLFVVMSVALGPVFLIPLALFRRFLGWRIAVPEEFLPADQSTTQFSLRQLLIWMGTTAVLLAWAKCIVPDTKPFQEGWPSFDVAGALFGGAMFGSLCLPILVCSIGLTLARRHRTRFVLGTIVSGSLFFLVFLLSTGSSSSINWREDLPQIGCLEGGLLVVLFSTFLLLRLCGYRLLRRNDEQLVPASPAIIDAEPPAKRRPMSKAPFPYLVAAILLFGFSLCWPVGKQELVRRDMAFQHAWKAVGAQVDFEAGELKRLSFPNFPASEAGLRKLQELRSFPAFKELGLGGKEWTDDKMPYLRGLATLRDLYLGDSPLTDAGLAQLDGLDNLHTLRLPKTQITDEGLKHLQRFPSLQYLGLQDTQITGEGFAYLQSLPNLTSLELQNSRITDAGLVHVAGLHQLRSLNLESTAITDVGLAHVASLHQLRGLYLWNTSITDAGLAPLSSLENLDTLLLFGTQVTDAGLVHLVRLKNLTVLNPGNRITDAGMKHLAQLKSLKSLWLTGPRITDAGLPYLTNLPNLRELGLTEAQITDAGIKDIQQFANLEVLWLNGTQITDAALVQLQSLKKLRFLNPYDSQATEQGIEAFQRARPDCQVDKFQRSP